MEIALSIFAGLGIAAVLFLIVLAFNWLLEAIIEKYHERQEEKEELRELIKKLKEKE